MVRGNQDDKALAQYVQWQSGKPLVRLFSLFVADTSPFCVSGIFAIIVFVHAELPPRSGFACSLVLSAHFIQVKINRAIIVDITTLQACLSACSICCSVVCDLRIELPASEECLQEQQIKNRSCI